MIFFENIEIIELSFLKIQTPNKVNDWDNNIRSVIKLVMSHMPWKNELALGWVFFNIIVCNHFSMATVDNFIVSSMNYEQSSIIILNLSHVVKMTFYNVSYTAYKIFGHTRNV